jgi:Tfp pilus assembly protein PilO
MAALTRTGKKERNARLLGVLVLGAIISLSTTYLLAPRFQEPTQIAEEANINLGTKILINERLSLLSVQEGKRGVARAELLDLQAQFPRETEVTSLEQSINVAIGSVGMTQNALTALSFQNEFIAISNPNGAIDPNAAGAAPVQEDENGLPQASMYSKAFEMTVIGDSDSLNSLVNELLNLERVIVIDSLSIAYNAKSNSSQLSIKARTFLMPNTIADGSDGLDLEKVDSLGNAIADE